LVEKREWGVGGSREWGEGERGRGREWEIRGVQ